MVTTTARNAAGGLAALALLAACATAATGPGLALGTVSDVTVGESAADAGAFCADFALDAQQAQDAIRASRPIAAQAYASADHLPCTVTGTARLDGVTLTWLFDAGGTGTLSHPSGETTYLDCAKCRRTFGASRR